MPNFRVLASILVDISNFLPEGRMRGVFLSVNGPRYRALPFPKEQEAYPVAPFCPSNCQKLALS